MRISNIFVLIILALGFSCTKREKPRTILSLWSQNISQSTPVVDRKLASSKNQCFNEIYSVQTLKEEVKDLESKYFPSEEINGYWKHLNLAELPHPQALFLKLFGDKIGDLAKPDRIDYSSCADLPCVINKVYGKEDSPNGYVHYIWFLKFGHMLSFDNDVYSETPGRPGTYKGQEIAFERFLFKDEELFHFWRASYLVKAPFTALPHMKEVQRVPQNYDVKLNGSKVCGLAYTTGTLLLMDCGLDTSKTKYGSLTWTLLHELGHQVDSHNGLGSKNIYSSKDQSYLDLVGFLPLKEYMENGQLVSKWEMKPGALAVTDYARQSPVENFAESISLFRINGVETKKNMSPGQWNFTSKKFYNDKSFIPESLMESWIQEKSSLINSNILKSIVSCAENATVPMLSCINSSLQDSSNEIRASISASQPEACDTFKEDNQRERWNSAYTKYSTPRVEKYLDIVQKDKNSIALMTDLMGEIPSLNLAKDSYVACYGKTPMEDCYREEFLIRIRDKVNGLNLAGDAFLAIEELLLSQHPFEETKDRVQESYHQIVMGQTVNAKISAGRLWNKCTTGPQDDDVPPSGKLFKVYGGYMVSSVFNCINLGLKSSISEAIEQITYAGYKVEDKNEEKILYDFILSKLTEALLEKYEKARNDEVKVSANYYYGVSFYAPTKRVNQEQCINHFVNQIKFEPLYNLKKDLYSDLLKKGYCSKYAP